MLARDRLARPPSAAPSVARPAITALGPGSGEVIVERPAPGLARGKYAWPPWAIALFGASVVLVTLVYFLLRLRSGKRR